MPGEGAGSEPRSEGSVRVAAGLCRLARACSAGHWAPAPRRGRRGEAPRVPAVPAAATRASGAALAAAAAGAESVAAAGRLLGVEQHLRSHACFLKRSSPNCAPSDVSAARLPRQPPPPTAPSRAFPPPAPSLLSRAPAGRRLAARGAGKFSALGLGGRGADSGAQHRVRAAAPPPSPLRCGDPDPRAEGDPSEGHTQLRRDRRMQHASSKPTSNNGWNTWSDLEEEKKKKKD